MQMQQRMSQFPNPGGFTPAAPGAEMMHAGMGQPYNMNYPNMNQRGAMGAPTQQQFNQYMRQWQRKHRGGGAGAAAAPGTPGAGGTVTDPSGNPVDPNSAVHDADGNYIGIASDVYGHTVQDGSGTGTGTGAGGYSADFDPRTGMPSHGNLDSLASQMAARRKQLLGSGRGQQDVPYADMRTQRIAERNKFLKDRGSAIDANMQTLLSAQAAGTTLTPDQLSWLTRMQGKRGGGAA
jgi:hypothetical protein